MADGGCIACDVVSGRIVPPGGIILDDGLWVLSHSVSPVLLRGWLILEPRRHVEHLAELTEPEAASLGLLIGRVSSALMRALQAEKVYACSFGELVRHVHWYLIPRYADMSVHGVAVLNEMFANPSPWACGDEDAAEAASGVRAALSEPSE
jgi:diadenosine tetraphosphate (Ap4A) HIT family hydrolase